MQVFLDVDDLEDLVFLERDIKATAVVLLFLTKSYFKSINCLREIRACEEEDKPLILVRETAPNKGGALVSLLVDECPEDLRQFVFSEDHAAKIIPFYRLERVWAMTLQQICTLAIGYSTHIITLKQWHSKQSSKQSLPTGTHLLRGGPSRRSVLRSIGSRRSTLRRNAAASASADADPDADPDADVDADADPATSASAAAAAPVPAAASALGSAVTATDRWNEAQAAVLGSLNLPAEEASSEGSTSAPAPGHSRNSSRDSSSMDMEPSVRGHLFPKKKTVKKVATQATALGLPPPVVFPELYYPEEPGCCRAGRRGDDGEELESAAVLFVSEDNPGAADIARELQQAADPAPMPYPDPDPYPYPYPYPEPGAPPRLAPHVGHPLAARPRRTARRAAAPQPV